MCEGMRKGKEEGWDGSVVRRPADHAQRGCKKTTVKVENRSRVVDTNVYDDHS